MNWTQTKEFLQQCLPANVGDALNKLQPGELQEIRMRCGKRCHLRTAGQSFPVDWTPEKRDIETTAEALCGHGLYTRQAEMRQGYVTLRGGHRLGICGGIQMQSGNPDMLSGMGSLCLRIAAEWPGAADCLIPLCKGTGTPKSMLIIGGCGTGKTTILRDIARQLAGGEAPFQVAVVDERGEIGACEHGVPQLDTGETSDVLDGCPKGEAITWLMRSMSPQVIVTDELADAVDVSAVMDAAACGCAVIASVHGTSLNDLATRPVMAAMMARRVFAYYTVLSPDGCGQISAVYDRNGSPVRWQT